MTTGIVSWPSTPHSRSSVTPSVSGIQMSSSTSAGCWRCAVRARFACVLGERDAVALVLQDLGQQLADADFVVDDQDFARLRHSRIRHASASLDRCAMPVSAMRPRCSRAFMQPPRGFERPEMQRYARAVRRNVLERHATAVLVDDLLHDCQAQAGAFCLGRHIRLERVLEHVLRLAWMDGYGTVGWAFRAISGRSQAVGRVWLTTARLSRKRSVDANGAHVLAARLTEAALITD